MSATHTCFDTAKLYTFCSLLTRGRHHEAFCLAEHLNGPERDYPAPAGAAPADGLASHPREASGRRPSLLRGIAFSGRTRTDERGRNPVGPRVKTLSGRIRTVPGTEIAAVERREARHPLRGMPTLCRRASPASSAWRDKSVGAPLGAPLPRIFFRGSTPPGPLGKRRQAPAASAKNAGDDACRSRVYPVIGDK